MKFSTVEQIAWQTFFKSLDECNESEARVCHEYVKRRRFPNDFEMMRRIEYENKIPQTSK